MRVEYVPMQESKGYDVDSYFQMHSGCAVTLYQDVKVITALEILSMP